MHDRQEPTLSAGDSNIRQQKPFDDGPIFHEPPDRSSEEPSFLFWIAAIALGIVLGGLGVKLITNWYGSRQAEAVVRQFVVAMTDVNEQSEQARAHAAAVAEKQRSQETALKAERHRIERLRIAAAEQATAEKTRRDAAWAKFYRPSAACQDPGQPSHDEMCERVSTRAEGISAALVARLDVAPNGSAPSACQH